MLFLDKKEFTKKYVMFPQEAPTASARELADEVIRMCTEGNVKLKDINYLNVVKRLKLWSSFKKEATILSKFDKPSFYKFVELSITTKLNKQVVMTPSMYSKANDLVKAIEEDENVKGNFINTTKDLQNIFQYKLEFIYEGIKFLGYIDILQINHKKKTIQIKDLKTTSMPVRGFVGSFFKWNYYIQGGLYSLGIEQIMKDLKLDGYEVLPFEFIYSSFLSNSTITYIFTEKWLLASIYGFYNGGRYYKGIKQLINDIKWHFDEQVFDKSRFIHQNNSKIEIPSDFIKTTEDRYEGE